MKLALTFGIVALILTTQAFAADGTVMQSNSPVLFKGTVCKTQHAAESIYRAHQSGGYTAALQRLKSLQQPPAGASLCSTGTWYLTPKRRISSFVGLHIPESILPFTGHVLEVEMAERTFYALSRVDLDLHV